LLPVREFGCGSVTTCWNRFAEWARAGVFDRLQEQLLDELGTAGLLDWSRVSVDSASVRAVRGDLCGANPVDRAKRGCKWHLAVERAGMVLSLLLGAANRPDQELFAAVLDDIAMVATPAGGRRCRPAKCHGDKGYDYRHCRAYLRRRGITARIARKGVEPSDRLGRHRWQAEQSIAWLLGCRRLRVRYERAAERFSAFGLLACCRLACNRWTDHTTIRPDRPVLAW
jgi:transposase